jgi:hypothetical protein
MLIARRSWDTVLDVKWILPTRDQKLFLTVTENLVLELAAHPIRQTFELHFGDVYSQTCHIHLAAPLDTAPDQPCPMQALLSKQRLPILFGLFGVRKMWHQELNLSLKLGWSKAQHSFSGALCLRPILAA